MKYDYRCTKCKKEFEIERSLSDPRDDIYCPKCKSDEVERIYAPLNTLKSSSNKTCSSSCPTGNCPFMKS